MKRNSIICLYIVLIVILSSYIILDHKKDIKQAEELNKQTNIYKNIKDNYNDFVLINDDSYLYELDDDEYIKKGSISKNLYLELEKKEIKDYRDQYFKVNGLNYYVYYKDVKPTEKIKFNDRYKKYVPWNQSVKIKNEVKLYYDDETYITIINDKSFPIFIKDSDKLYIEYNNRLGYVINNEEIEIIDEVNSSLEKAMSVAVIAYHYTYNKAAGENCTNGIICHEEAQVESHFQYLIENNFFTPTMEEFEKYIDGKIHLPKKSVVITFDDGWWVHRMTILLNKYKLNGSLFLIGKLGSYEQWHSEYVEVHSHTYDMHDIGICPGGQGSPIKCLSRDKILADLAKSREQLHGTTVFCWPFYEYNDYSIGLVKEAGFTMAFRGGMIKATPGINKYLIPRYTIHNTTTVQGLANYIN